MKITIARLVACTLALASFAPGCRSASPSAAGAVAPAPSVSVPPPAAESPAEDAPLPTKPVPVRVRAPNVEALQEALAAEGHVVEIKAADNGEVMRLTFTNDVAAPAPPRAQFLAWMRAHGAALGYGPVAPPSAIRATELTGPITSLQAEFPSPPGCSGRLAAEAAFEDMGDGALAPRVWGFSCSSSTYNHGASTWSERFHAFVVGLNDERKPPQPAIDPLLFWLLSQGATAPRIFGRPGASRALTSSTAPLTLPPGDRLAVARGFAERTALAMGLPPLDRVRLESDRPTDPATLTKEFTKLTLDLRRPPLDGKCIDPRVELTLGDRNVHIVDVQCAKEPTDGTNLAPPRAPGSPLPRAASATMPYLLFCESFVWSSGFVDHYGTLVDKRGDVFSSYGGLPISGKSIHELEVLARNGRRYQGTLPPADVDRLVALSGQVASEPLKTHDEKPIPDAGGGSCFLLVHGATEDAMTEIILTEDGGRTGQRVGPASSEAQRILARVRRLERAPPESPHL